MVVTMSSKKRYGDPIVTRNEDRRGRISPGSYGVDAGHGLKSLDVAEASTANNGDMDGLWEYQ